MPRRDTSFSEFVRDYLADEGEAYVKELHNAYERYCENNDYSPPSYDSARSTVWQLKKLGLIEAGRQEGTTGGLQPKQYYRLAPGATAEDWSDPRGQLYPR